MTIELRKPERHDIGPMWSVRTRAIQAIPRCYYNQTTLQTWANVPMPAEFPEAITALASVAALCGGQLVGWGMLDQGACRLEALFVDPNLQRRGIAREIYSTLEAEGLTRAIRVLSLSSTLNAVSFYERMGFIRREHSQYHHPSGFVLDCVQMEKEMVCTVIA